MALIKDMQETDVHYHSKTNALYIGEGLFYLNYNINNDLLLSFLISNHMKLNRLKWHHNPYGPMESTNDIRWIINKLYND